MPEGDLVRIHDIELECKHCRHTTFVMRKSQLNTALLTFLNLDWLNASAEVYVCTRCGYLHWFLTAAREEADASEPISCMVCGETLQGGEEVCSSCGWTYKEDVP